MSDDDQPVMVEHPSIEEEEDILSSPEPLQIVSVGSEENAYAFSFHEEALNDILAKVPPGWKVSVVSVVGAFRTGKSFLLSWFLRYLDRLQKNQKDPENASKDEKWYEGFQSLGHDGFDWRGGSERNTTGIWMWSQPYFLEKSDGSQLAILLVDTQGMFDHETTMALTASIFGLSTLLSSYQIYNVDKRIQEDNLQQLALFSEYARMAMSTHDDDDDDEAQEATVAKPFQRIEFLVRDWQHFEEEEDYDEMEKEMGTYLDGVIAERDAKDLQDTRQQILSCFKNVSCYAMTHPGFAVTKRKYTGDVNVMEKTFLELLDRYCGRVFNVEEMQPKIIHGRELTSVELGSYIKAYAALFASGAHFPEASTLLEATASANNTNAVHNAMSLYKDTMDRIAGPNCSNYVRPQELQELHEEATAISIDKFAGIANFGSQSDIDKAKSRLLQQLRESYEMYSSLNEGRNPLAGMEMYIIPMSIALVSFILRWVADLTCSPYSQVCKAGSDVLSHLYAVGLCFMCIIAATKAKQISEGVGRVKAALGVLNESSASKKND